MKTNKILCSVSTRGRYDTTLFATLCAIVNQTLAPDKIVLFDDNDEPKDLRDIDHYRKLFSIMTQKGIRWEVLYGEKLGPHFNHQRANLMGYEWVWRVDDDCIPEPDTLHQLSKYIRSDIGAIGGAVLTEGFSAGASTGLIDDVFTSIQWSPIENVKIVDHLHCSFLYRAGVADYHLGLSKVGHREETLFTYALKQKGYELLVVPNATTWHLKTSSGGIRDGVQDMYKHDEVMFSNFIQLKDKTIVVLDCGMGDHIVFKHVLPHIKNPEVFSCYPDIVPGKSIAEAKYMFGDLTQWNIYAKMMHWDWEQSLENAFRKLYL